MEAMKMSSGRSSTGGGCGCSSVWVQTGRLGFDPWQKQRVLPLACVQTTSEAHPASYPMGTEGPFPGVKRGRSVTLTTHPPT
jgi:hypothetical protein